MCVHAPHRASFSGLELPARASHDAHGTIPALYDGFYEQMGGRKPRFAAMARAVVVLLALMVSLSVCARPTSLGP